MVNKMDPNNLSAMDPSNLSYLLLKGIIPDQGGKKYATKQNMSHKIKTHVSGNH